MNRLPKRPITKKPITLQVKLYSILFILGEVLKNHISKLRRVPNQKVELVFLVDSSASVGAENFFSELKFVRKLLADFTVSLNSTRVSVITFASKHSVVNHIDHLTEPSDQKHKCSLLNEELPDIKYVGGGTYTYGAIQEAQVNTLIFIST